MGHLQTLYYNNDYAKSHSDGLCYAIVDDRQNPERSRHIQNDLDYLKTDKITVISVAEFAESIHYYTRELAKAGYIYIPNSYSSGTLLAQLSDPVGNFQIKLKYGGHPTIGYSKEVDGHHIIVYIFDYIIKVLDDLLNITDVITTAPNDVADYDIMNFFIERKPIRFHRLETYRILGFRYSKRDWPSLAESDPRLMTLQGLCARHVPSEVLYKFYSHAIKNQSAHDFGGAIKITHFDTLLKTHMNLTAERAFAVIDPLKVTVTNLEERYTEYVYKPLHPMNKSEFNIVPLSNVIYIDQSDFSLIDHPHKLSNNREIRLKYSNVLYCTDVVMDSSYTRPVELKAMYYIRETERKSSIHWISQEAGREPKRARFYLYNWFFTGENALNIQEPVIRDGFIEDHVFNDLSKVYQIERHGYFVYDKKLSDANEVPCFIKIVNIR